MKRGVRKKDKIRLSSPVVPGNFFIMSVSGETFIRERRKN